MTCVSGGTDDMATVVDVDVDVMLIGDGAAGGHDDAGSACDVCSGVVAYV